MGCETDKFDPIIDIFLGVNMARPSGLEASQGG